MASSALGAITLVTGPEEFLAERAVHRVRAEVLAVDTAAEVSDTTGDALSMASLGELTAPSLFSSTRCVVVRKFEDLPDESVAGILDYAAAPADDVALVLVHSGGQRGSGVLTKLRKVPSVSEVKSVALKPSEFSGFVINELRDLGVRISGDASGFLVQAVGQDLRGLAAAASQLANDFDGKPVTLEMVQQYFGGRAEVKSFAIADHAMNGNINAALEQLRWALERGTAPVLVTSAVAGSLRSLAKLKGAPRGTRNNDLMREVGAPAWKIDQLRKQAQGWEEAGLARAIRSVARADAGVKGAATDPAYALEKMIIDVVSARGAR